MRCIEMAKNALGDVSELLININMRCIEISLELPPLQVQHGLTLT